MIERVARALVVAERPGCGDTSWDTLGQHSQDRYRRMARAAIEVVKGG